MAKKEPTFTFIEGKIKIKNKMEDSQNHPLNAKKVFLSILHVLCFFGVPLCTISSGQLILMSVMLFVVGSNV